MSEAKHNELDRPHCSLVAPKRLFPASKLQNIPWPKCYKECAMVRVFGVGECESVCPQKFKANAKILP